MARVLRVAQAAEDDINAVVSQGDGGGGGREVSPWRRGSQRGVEMTTIEKVLIVLNYHDGPIEGISCGEQSGHYFHALFREDLDEYDDVFSVMALDEAARREAATLLADARLKDPVVRDPTRRAFVYALRAQFDALLEKRSADIRRCLPNFRTLTGGTSGDYDVMWQDVESRPPGDRGTR